MVIVLEAYHDKTTFALAVCVLRADLHSTTLPHAYEPRTNYTLAHAKIAYNSTAHLSRHRFQNSRYGDNYM